MEETELRQFLAPLTPDLQNRLWEGRRPAIQYATQRRSPRDPAPLGSSKLGGLPDLPVDRGWPTWTGPRKNLSPRPLAFFAQLELSTVSAHLDLGLPGDGLLYFFADYDFDGKSDGITGLYGDEFEGARVLFAPAGAELERTKAPLTVELLVEAVATPLKTWTVSAGTPDDDQYDMLDGVNQAIRARVHSRVPDGFEIHGLHQLGGIADYIQHPVEEEVVQAVHDVYRRGTGFDSERWKPVADQVKLWALLFQLDSDNSLDLMFGDAGTLYWAAAKAEIAMGDFRGTRFNFQCS